MGKQRLELISNDLSSQAEKKEANNVVLKWFSRPSGDITERDMERRPHMVDNWRRRSAPRPPLHRLHEHRRRLRSLQSYRTRCTRRVSWVLDGGVGCHRRHHSRGLRLRRRLWRLHFLKRWLWMARRPWIGYNNDIFVRAKKTETAETTSISLCKETPKTWINNNNQSIFTKVEREKLWWIYNNFCTSACPRAKAIFLFADGQLFGDDLKVNRLSLKSRSAGRSSRRRVCVFAFIGPSRIVQCSIEWESTKHQNNISTHSLTFYCGERCARMKGPNRKACGRRNNEPGQRRMY